MVQDVSGERVRKKVARTQPQLREERKLQGQIEHLQRQVQELESLNDLSQKISSEVDPDSIMEAILDHVIGYTGAEQGSVMMLSRDPEQLMKTVVRGTRGGKGDIVYRLGSNVTGWVARNKMPLVVPDIALDCRFQGIGMTQLNVKSVLSVPLMVKGEVVGAINLINKPGRGAFDKEDLRVVTIVAGQSAQILENARLMADLKRANADLEVARRDLEQENISLKEDLQDRYSFEGVIGKSPVMRELYDKIRHILDDDSPVLLTGETGTGKELIAKAIHYNGNRKHRRFLPINCGALTETLLESELFGHVKGAFTDAARDKKGLFETADGGTLFLDEIQHMSPATQVKLLRVLQEKEIRKVGGTKNIPVNVRILCATNEDLRDLVEKGRFRRDLFYRINVVEVTVPPLRFRTEDIPLLVAHFLDKYTREKRKNVPGIKKDALDLMMRYLWAENNVRELENEIERIVIFAQDGQPIGSDLLKEEIRSLDVKAHVPPSGERPLAEIMEAVERRAIISALEEADGNKSKAARSLGIYRDRLYSLLKKHGIA